MGAAEFGAAVMLAIGLMTEEMRSEAPRGEGGTSTTTPITVALVIVMTKVSRTVTAVMTVLMPVRAGGAVASTKAEIMMGTVDAVAQEGGEWGTTELELQMVMEKLVILEIETMWMGEGEIVIVEAVPGVGHPEAGGATYMAVPLRQLEQREALLLEAMVLVGTAQQGALGARLLVVPTTDGESDRQGVQQAHRPMQTFSQQHVHYATVALRFQTMPQPLYTSIRIIRTGAQKTNKDSWMCR